MYIGL